MSDVKYTLKWANMNDTPMLRAACEHMNTFPLWRDSNAHIITVEEYNALVAEGSILPPTSYWSVNEASHSRYDTGEAYDKYTTTWQLIGTAKEDFCDGWRACEKHTANMPVPVKPKVRRTSKHSVTVEI